MATPANGKPGEDGILTSAVSDEEGKKFYPRIRQPKPYLRYVPQPRA
jgi:hypothetical protein